MKVSDQWSPIMTLKNLWKTDKCWLTHFESFTLKSFVFLWLPLHARVSTSPRVLLFLFLLDPLNFHSLGSDAKNKVDLFISLTARWYFWQNIFLGFIYLLADVLLDYTYHCFIVHFSSLTTQARVFSQKMVARLQYGLLGDKFPLNTFLSLFCVTSIIFHLSEFINEWPCPRSDKAELLFFIFELPITHVSPDFFFSLCRWNL